MKIGIFTIGLEGLKLLKAAAQELPEYDYELYVETRHKLKLAPEAFDIESTVGEGVKELIRRQAKLVLVLEQNQIIVSEQFPNVKIIFSKTPTELKNFLNENPNLEKSLSQNQTRNVTLTEHTPETDLAVVTILGATLIRE